MLTSMPEVLYELRSRLGYSQEEVAAAIDVSRVTYTRYENGTHKPDAFAAVKLAHLFGVPVEYILCMELPEDDEDLASLQVSIRHLNAAGRRQLDKYIGYLLADPEYKRAVRIGNVIKYDF